jgi:hypothetical protein
MVTGKAVHVDAIAAYKERRGTAPLTFNLRITWSSAAKFTSRPVYSRKITLILINIRPGGPQSLCGCFAEKKHL